MSALHVCRSIVSQILYRDLGSKIEFAQSLQHVFDRALDRTHLPHGRVLAKLVARFFLVALVHINRSEVRNVRLVQMNALRSNNAFAKLGANALDGVYDVQLLSRSVDFEWHVVKGYHLLLERFVVEVRHIGLFAVRRDGPEHFIHQGSTETLEKPRRSLVVRRVDLDTQSAVVDSLHNIAVNFALIVKHRLEFVVVEEQPGAQRRGAHSGKGLAFLGACHV